MKLRYFAWVRVQVGYAEENIALPPQLATVGDLLAWMATRGPNFAAALARPEAIRVAVDQTSVDRDYPLAAAREIALFPPMTGG
jgi:molybdopterin synthase sulfur carrier subunit